MLNPADVKGLWIQRMMTRNVETGQLVESYVLHFSIRGQGDYVAIVPVSGYTKAIAEAAIIAVAEPIVETLDAFPG